MLTEDGAKVLGGCIGSLIVIVAFAFLMAWILCVVWNFVMPSVFNLPELTYWQAFAIMVLINFITSRFRNNSSK